MVTGRKLLLADDSATIQKVVDLTFSDEGLEVVTVSDGRQAIEKLDEVLPDIVLADIFMPGMNGYEVCEYIKRTERFSHIPVMLLVGSFEPFDEAEARRVGADDYLTKPFQSIRTLIGKVGGLLSGGGSNEDATTRKLVPPPGAEKENRPETGFLERSTADTAPLPQHEREQRESAANSAREVSYNDLSMDDELIETMPGYGYAGGGGPHGTDAQDPRLTAQYSAADFAEAGISPAQMRAPAPQEEESFDGYSTVPMGQSSPAQTPAPVASQQPAVASGRASNLASADDALLDLGDLDAPPSMVEADDFILDLRDEAAEASAPTFETPLFETASAPSASAEELDAAARTDYETETAQAQGEYAEAQAFVGEQASAFAPVEEEAAIAEEAAPVEEAARVSGYQPADAETPTEEFYMNAQAAPTERLPDDFQMAGTTAAAPTTEAETGAPATAETTALTATAGQITLEQLSPEAIDAIARRAVELLSERVVEQIAWEVVPDLAERLIKRRLEQEK
ncbi:MAG TPA: response regulator [Pyrinomonadaceae bacterium]|nr:response regulator [Pyrinomonadaceae bacterium]